MPDDQDFGSGSDPAGPDVHLPGIDTRLFADDPGANGDPAADESIPDGTVEEFAEEFDTQALEDGSSDAAEGGDKGKGKGDGDGKPTPDDPLTDFIAKNFKGDKNAFLHAQYASREEGKRLSEENKRKDEEIARLRAAAAPPRDRSADLKAALESSSEVRTFNRELKAISEDDKRIADEQLSFVSTARDLESELKKVNADLEHEDDPKTVSKLNRRASSIESSLHALDAKWNSNKATLRANNSERRTLQSDLVRAQRDIESEMADRESREESDRTFVARQHRTFNTAYHNSITQYDGVDPEKNPRKYKLLHTTIKETVADYLDQINSPDLDPTELAQVVGRVTVATAAEFGLKRKAGAAAGGKGPAPRKPLIPSVPQRQPVNARPGASGNSPEARNRAELLKDPDFVRKRATAVFNATKMRAQR